MKNNKDVKDLIEENERYIKYIKELENDNKTLQKEYNKKIKVLKDKLDKKNLRKDNKIDKLQDDNETLRRRLDSNTLLLINALDKIENKAKRSK